MLTVEQVSPDKLRVWIIGLTPGLFDGIHTVEISDDRSNGHFLTFFGSKKALNLLPPGIDQTHHDPKIYHRDDEGCMWVGDHYRRAFKFQWTEHFHWTLKQPPTVKDFDQVLSVLPQGLIPDELIRGVRQLLARTQPNEDYHGQDEG